MFYGFDSLGRGAAEPVFQIVGDALAIVEFAFNYDLLNHAYIMNLSGMRVKDYYAGLRLVG